MRWSPTGLSRNARLVSASRRTDVPALWGPWFEGRLEAGFAEYVPVGPPRRCRASLRPEDVLAFVFWTRWPRPFLPVLDRVLADGFPVGMNVTVTGLGGTAVEPGTPDPERGLAALLEVADRLPQGAVLWRFDPVFVSRDWPTSHALERFRRLAGPLAGRVHRVAISFVTPYVRQVGPDLRRYEAETGDRVEAADEGRRAEVAQALSELAKEAGIPLVACCDPALSGLAPAACNAFGWLQAAWPDLRPLKAPPLAPGREGCACSREVDIGVYDTCTLGCRYCYATRDRDTARRRMALHDPALPCLLP